MRVNSFRSLSRTATAIGLAIAAVTAYAGSASAFQITPITQDFTPTGRGASQNFQIVNDRDEQVTVTVNIASREVDVNGNEVMKPTGEFTVFPTEVVVPPKSTQVVRAKWIGDSAPSSELAYRLVAEEVPLKVRRDTPGASIYMTVRYVGSLYVVPKGVRANVKVLSAEPIVGADGKTRLQVLVENSGTAHAILDNPTLTVKSGAVIKQLAGPALDGNMLEENVLSQHTRKFVVNWPEGIPTGPLEASLAFNPQR
jgi:fimbrial chaperone protein